MAKGGAERRQRKDDEEQQPDQYSQLRKASRLPPYVLAYIERGELYNSQSAAAAAAGRLI
jgi:hypothetical protein